MREKRESPSLVAMRARGALLAMCERSPSRAHRDLESALATPTAAYLELAGRKEPSTHGLISEIEAGLLQGHPARVLLSIYLSSYLACSGHAGKKNPLFFA